MVFLYTSFAILVVVAAQFDPTSEHGNASSDTEDDPESSGSTDQCPIKNHRGFLKRVCQKTIFMEDYLQCHNSDQRYQVFYIQLLSYGYTNTWCSAQLQAHSDWPNEIF